jgi:hypothetical protein
LLFWLSFRSAAKESASRSRSERPFFSPHNCHLDRTLSVAEGEWRDPCIGICFCRCICT